jgi:hypothetical protein
MIRPEDISRPDVVDAVRAAFDVYEAALVSGDHEALDDAFWASSSAVRFGVRDRQTGADEIRRWRAGQGPLVGRSLSATQVVGLGNDIAIVTTLFGYPSTAAEGRQTQVWARLPEGWRIVSAHVSQVPTGPGD